MAGLINGGSLNSITTMMIRPETYNRMKVSVRNIDAVSKPPPANLNIRRVGVKRIKAMKALSSEHIAATLDPTLACINDCFSTVSRAELLRLRLDYYSQAQPEQATVVLEHLNSRASNSPFYLFDRDFCDSCFCRAFHITSKHLYDLRKRIDAHGSR
jgi:hypothetical protein